MRIVPLGYRYLRGKVSRHYCDGLVSLVHALSSDELVIQEADEIDGLQRTGCLNIRSFNFHEIKTSDPGMAPHILSFLQPSHGFCDFPALTSFASKVERVNHLQQSVLTWEIGSSHAVCPLPNLKPSVKFRPDTHEFMVLRPISIDEFGNRAVLDIVNFSNNNVKRIKIPVFLENDYEGRTTELQSCFLVVCPESFLLVVDVSGKCILIDGDPDRFQSDMERWKKFVGESPRDLQLVSGEEGALISETERSGSGSGDGAGDGDGDPSKTSSSMGGGGGSGGPGGAQAGPEGRKSGTIDAGSFQLRSIGQVAKELSEAQREMHDLAIKERMKALRMNESDMMVFFVFDLIEICEQSYRKYHSNVRREIQELRAILQTVQAKNKERVWLKHQISGDLDESRLIEGVVGEKNVYKRRGKV